MKNTEVEKIYDSRRGPFKMVAPLSIEIIPEEFKISYKRLADVREEIEYAKQGKLADHKYWDNEPQEFTLEYQVLYQTLFDVDKWIHYKDARHNVVANPVTCVTLVQYFDGELIIYSRSTDMKNGYFGDKVVIHLLREAIREAGYPVEVTKWLKANAHEYIEPGIARLVDIEGYTL